MIRTDIINTKKLFKSIFVAALATAVLASSMIHVFAMPPYDNIPEGVSEETWNRLQDNTIEYDEIGDLVQYFNPSYTMAMDSAGGNHRSIQHLLQGYGSWLGYRQYKGCHIRDKLGYGKSRSL